MMNNKDTMIKFINVVNNNGMLTELIKYIFDYDYLFDNNYIFRLIDDNNYVILDIYDNISANKFNRYIYDFMDDNYNVLKYYENDIYIRKISVKNINNNDNNIIKFGYLFNLDIKMMIDYADKFLDDKFVKILDDILKK